MLRSKLLAMNSLTAAALLVSRLAGAQDVPPPGVPVPTGAPPPTVVPGVATPIQAAPQPSAQDLELSSFGTRQGWNPRLSLGATGSFSNNSDVAGQLNGNTVSLGLRLDTGIDLNTGGHEWRNALIVGGATTRTPVIPEFVKTSDLLALDSTYLYHVVFWFGPFARGTFTTSMFPGTDIRALPVVYQITRADGTQQPPTASSTRLALSDPFRPATFRESAGLFLQFYRSTPFNVEVRGGAGAQEVIADNQLTLRDDPRTPNIEVQELKTINQIGPEAALSLWGELLDKKLLYRINADVMTPFAHGALLSVDTRNAFALTNFQVNATLSYRLTRYASLDYQFKLLRQPELVDATQIQNALLLTFGFSAARSPSPSSPLWPPGLPPA